MKKALLILSAALFLNICAQAPLLAEVSFTLNEFYSGNIDLKMSFNSEFLYGSRGDGLRQGGAVSTLDYTPSISSYNPAMLAFLEGGYGAVGLYPVSLLSSDTVGFFMGQNIGASIGEVLNDQIGSASGITIAAGVDFSVNTNNVHLGAGQATGFTNIEIGVPFAGNQAAIGFARESKNFLEITGMISGFEGLVSVTDDANPAIDFDIRAKINALIQVNSYNVVTTWAIGRKLADGVGVGVALEHYDSLFEARGQAVIDGTATYAGNTMQFNTSEENSLAQDASGSLYGEAWGLRFGGSIHLANNAFELGLDCGIEPEIKYSGDVSVIYHTIPDAIDTSDITRTQREELSGTEGTLKIKLPTYARGTLAFRSGMVGVLNYTHYFDGFAFRWEGAEQTDTFNVRMLDDIRLGLSFSVFQLGFGLVYTNVSTVEDEAARNLYWGVMPLLSGGVSIPFDKVKLEVDLLAFPLVVLKTAVSYQF